ncbi:hypothetical protein IE81DRAFT_18611 [Ceraceosorus guamensis]|uniref:ferric-chelate reductase (NADPH) n=1 Tax=Ceraceosorus guamensis TaxID=1522189 RepID=A0A316W5M8_9BASI|nr:hypothetical protein IE81DRAFT_18611 [Ceraceosorus guamensis]PWN44388.1 hypothetical protein IE81DRAFT_18611 [Ceraceosorus guamensis]
MTLIDLVLPLSKRHGGHGDADEPYDPDEHGPNNRPPSAERLAAMLHADNWYDMQKYANRVTWLMLAILILVTVGPGLLHRLRVHRPKLAVSLQRRLPFYFKLVSWGRSVGYLQKGRILPGFRLPALGASIAIALFCAAIFGWTLGVRPYYRKTREWGSPPLAIRAGMLANAMIPFLLALATKVNVISILTAVSHERLQWLARLILTLSLIHTIPFIWQPLTEGGSSNLWAWWKSDYVTYWNGTVALSLMIWMVLSSTRVFRNMSYEFFVIQHIVSTLLFIGFYFFHTDNTLNSWIWLWAAVGVWGFATLIKWARSATASRYFVGAKASVEVSGEELVAGEEMLRIALKTNVRWWPGAHVFIRFPTLAPLQSHPFTIVNLPQPDHHCDSELVLVARVHDGITRKLLKHARSKAASVEAEDDIESESIYMTKQNSSHPLRAVPESSEAYALDSGDAPLLPTRACMVPAIIDGPYGQSSASLQAFDHVLILAGGVGITFATSACMHLAMANADRIQTRSVHLVWSVRSRASLAWFQPYLDAISERFAASKVAYTFTLHITRECISASDAVSRSNSAPEADFGAEKWTAYRGAARERPASLERPHVPSIIRDAAQHAANSSARSLAVVVCGPAGMSDAAANATARLQHDRKGLDEIWLLNESFGW